MLCFGLFVSNTKRPIGLFIGDQTIGADLELHFLLCENSESETETEKKNAPINRLEIGNQPIRT